MAPQSHATSDSDPAGDGISRHRSKRSRWAWAAGVALVLVLFAAFYDAPVSRALMHWPAGERLAFSWLTRLGKADWILYPALVVLIVTFLMRGLHLRYWVRWTATALWGLSAYILAGVGLPSLVATLLKRLIGRARPMHLDEMGPLSFHPIQPDWSLASFPSGHATTAFAFAVVLSSLCPRRWAWLFYVIAGLIALSRVVTGMHFTTDVVAGALLGIAGARLVRDWCARRNFPVGQTATGVQSRIGGILARAVGRPGA